MEKSKEYLAINVLNEEKSVTYRLLSRALKIHVNTAKQLLFEFHQKQSTKSPGSVHATYLIQGHRRVEEPKQTNGTTDQDGEDTVMQSSPFMSSMPETTEQEDTIPALVNTVVLAKEEDFQDAKTLFERISCIHIYSLGPGPLKDLNVLSACNQEIAAKFNTIDPLQIHGIYGTIHNPNAKRRTMRQQPPPAASIAKPDTKSSTAKPSKPSTKPTEPPQMSKEESSKSDSGTQKGRRTSDPSTTKKIDTKKPATNREKSDLFKSFAKARSQPKKKEPVAEVAEASTAPSADTEDEPMEDASDGENEAEAVKKREASQAERKTRSEREAKLRKMMEESDEEEEKPGDEPMDDVPSPEDEENEDDHVTAIDKPQSKQEAPGKEQAVTITDGRRRGRRRVMKKRTMKDEDGYLVTKEEAVWESFSEDEPVPKKQKSTPSFPSKGVKKGGKPAQQGGIMSFFKKG